MSIKTWVEGIVRDAVKTAVDEAITDIKTELKTDIAAAEQNLTAQITALPGLLGSQIKNVAIDTEQIVQGVLQGIPNLLNPFGGSH